MKINNNIPAINSVRVLNARSLELNRNVAKLSSGERINTAGDDPLGFAVSEKMRTMISGLRSASRNAEDAISFIQTTEGYLMGAQDVMRRIKELAVQAANGIYSQSDRAQVEKELVQLVGEVDRIGQYANFNGLRMLNGEFAAPTAEAVPIASLFFHLGPEIDQRVQAYISTFSTTAMGLDNISISSPGQANQAIATVDNALEKINDQRTTLGAYQNRLNYVHANTEVAIDNFVEAESKIRDVDVAAEAIDIAKNILVNQANISVMAQANAQAQSVLRLLN